jgi:glyoxylase-like metal-dependent hydrolase (beta-lactamase superfamily II)
MTRDAQDEDRREFQEEREPSPEREEQPEEEPQHPGWLTLAQVFNSADPFFEKILFLLAYDYTSNIYVLRGDYLTIVDPGNDYTGFMDLFKLDCRPEDIKKIVLTHGHRDHCMGAFELLRAYPELAANGGFELILHPDTPAELKEVVKKFGCRITEVQGGETLELSGQEWEVMYTPGHTIDGLSFYHPPSKTAFTGDMAMPHAMAEPDHNAGGRLDHYLFGIKVLLQKDIANLLPGHGLPVASLGNRVVEQTYESLMLKIIGVEKEIPWIDGAKALELARQPDNLTAMQLKAYCLTDMGRCKESLDLLHQILEQQDDNVHALMATGHALLGMGNYQESIQYFDRALALNPEFQDPQMYKGMALYLSGRHDEAMDIEIFQKEFAQRIKQEFAKEPKAQS